MLNLLNLQDGPINLTLCKLLGMWVGVCHISMELTEELKREAQVAGVGIGKRERGTK